MTMMKLPHGDEALVEDGKLRDYVLNPRHPVGRHHARLFERLLGIRVSNAEFLKEALRAAALEPRPRESGMRLSMRNKNPFLDLPRRLLKVFMIRFELPRGRSSAPSPEISTRSGAPGSRRRTSSLL